MLLAEDIRDNEDLGRAKRSIKFDPICVSRADRSLARSLARPVASHLARSLPPSLPPSLDEAISAALIRHSIFRGDNVKNRSDRQIDGFNYPGTD